MSPPKAKKTLKQTAQETLAKNPSALGDPISLKAESSNTEPTPEDRPNKAANASSRPSSEANNNNGPSKKHQQIQGQAAGGGSETGEGMEGAGAEAKSGGDGDKKSLKDSALEALKKNPSALGDPISLKAEAADSEPTENDRGARGTGKSKL